MEDGDSVCICSLDTPDSSKGLRVLNPDLGKEYDILGRVLIRLMFPVNEGRSGSIEFFRQALHPKSIGPIRTFETQLTHRIRPKAVSRKDCARFVGEQQRLPRFLNLASNLRLLTTNVRDMTARQFGCLETPHHARVGVLA